MSVANSVPISKQMSKSVIKDKVQTCLIKHHTKARKRALEAFAEKARKKRKF